MRSTSELQAACESSLAANFALADSLSAQHVASGVTPKTPGQLMSAKMSAAAAKAASQQVSGMLKNSLKSAKQDLEVHKQAGLEILRAADHIETGAPLDHTNPLHQMATRLRKHVEAGFDARSTLRSMRNSVQDAFTETERFEKKWLFKSDLAVRFTSARLAVKMLKDQYSLERSHQAAEILFGRVKAENDAHRKNVLARKGV